MAKATKGKLAIQATFRDAAEGRVAREKKVDPPAGDAEAWGYIAGQWPGAPANALPPNCPVTALGRTQDNEYIFLDAMGELNRVKRDAFSYNILIDLFAGHPNYLHHHWPRWSKASEGKASVINGLEIKNATLALTNACAVAGSIEIADTVRSRGAWTIGPAAGLAGRGELVWHAGDGIYRVVPDRQTGLTKRVGTGPTSIDGIVYPGRAPIIVPWNAPVPVDDSPAGEIFALLKSWTYARKTLDPVLLLGWIGAAFLGGALPWRPYVFVTGDRGTGKTTLRNMMDAVLQSALLTRANATEANIRQTMGHQSLAAAVDELEAGEDNKRALDILDLARIAASGDTGGRGGAGGQPTSFTIRSTFWFSAINPPPMTAADKSRIALIALRQRDALNAKEPVVKDFWGPMLLRALMDAWPGYGDIFETWRQCLAQVRMQDRAQMTYGTLLALAEMMVGYDALRAHGLPMDDQKALGQWVYDQTMSERAEQRANWAKCLDRLFAWTIDAWKAGEKPTIGGVLEQLMAEGLTKEEAQARLKLVGLTVKQDCGKFYLAVPVSPDFGPAKVFEHTAYGGGGWSLALKSAPETVVIHDKKNWQVMKINGRAATCLMVDLAALDAEGLKEMEQ